MTEMTPADVPAELVKAASDGWWKASGEGLEWEDWLRVELAAVLPLHEQWLREQIANDLSRLPIAQHLGIPRSNATQHAADVAEAAQRWMITVVQCPDLIPESAGNEAKLNAKVHDGIAWPAGLPPMRADKGPAGGGDV